MDGAQVGEAATQAGTRRSRRCRAPSELPCAPLFHGMAWCDAAYGCVDGSERHMVWHGVTHIRVASTAAHEKVWHGVTPHTVASTAAHDKVWHRQFARFHTTPALPFVSA